MDGIVLYASHDRDFMEQTATALLDIDIAVWQALTKVNGQNYFVVTDLKVTTVIIGRKTACKTDTCANSSRAAAIKEAYFVTST